MITTKIINNRSHIFVFILFLLVFLLPACSIIKQVSIGKIEGIDFSIGTDGSLIIIADIPVKNPNAFKLKVQSLEADVIINNIEFGYLKSDKEIIIAANADKVYKLEAELVFKDAIAGVFSLLKIAKAKSIVLNVKGFGKVKALFITKKQDFEYNETVKL